MNIVANIRNKLNPNPVCHSVSLMYFVPHTHPHTHRHTHTHTHIHTHRHTQTHTHTHTHRHTQTHTHTHTHREWPGNHFSLYLIQQQHIKRTEYIITHKYNTHYCGLTTDSWPDLIRTTKTNTWCAPFRFQFSLMIPVNHLTPYRTELSTTKWGV